MLWVLIRIASCCGYSLESPHWGDSNEYPQHMRLWRTDKHDPLIINKYTPYLFHSLDNMLLNIGWNSNRQNNSTQCQGHKSHSMTKPSIWLVCPVKTLISLGICPVWSVYDMCSKDSQSPKASSCGQQSLWPDWVDAQADLSLCWTHSHFVGFVMQQLITLLNTSLLTS